MVGLREDRLITSNDFGATWSSRKSPLQGVRAACLSDSQRLFAVVGGAILVSDDFGETWSVAYRNDELALSVIRSVGANTVLVGGRTRGGRGKLEPAERAVVARSSDLGEAWRWQFVDGLTCVRAIVAAGKQSTWLSGPLPRTGKQQVIRLDRRGSSLRRWTIGADHCELVAVDGRVVAGVSGGTLLTVRGRRSEVFAKLPVGDQEFVALFELADRQLVAVTDMAVYLVSRKKEITCLARSRTVFWSAAVVGNGRLLLGTFDGRIRRIELGRAAR